MVAPTSIHSLGVRWMPVAAVSQSNRGSLAVPAKAPNWQRPAAL